MKTPPEPLELVIDDRMLNPLVLLMTEKEREAFYASGGESVPDRLKDVDTSKPTPGFLDKLPTE